MALGEDGRPVPVFVPDPKEMEKTHNPQSDASLGNQFSLVLKKADDALRDIQVVSDRMIELERKVHDMLPAKMLEVENRFNDIMVTRMKDYQRQFEDLQKAQSEFLTHAQTSLDQTLKQIREQAEHVSEDLRTQMKDITKSMPVPQLPGE
jgi:hypothetical protein